MYWTILSIVNYVLAAAAVVAVLRRPREPRAMLAWVLALILLPGIGLLLFLLIGEPRIARTRRRRRRRQQALGPSLSQHRAALQEEHAARQRVRVLPGLVNLVTLATRMSRHPPTEGNDVQIFFDAEQTFLALQLAIESARSHVHMEYYIFQPDATGRAIRDLLVKRRRAGVEIRLLLDAFGCLGWPAEFLRSFTDEGIEVAFFLPIVLWPWRWRVNLRNHRKIVVVDGEVGFTGSQNIGDEYSGRLRRYGPWRDTHLRVEGPAVHQLQQVFVEDWHFATGRELVKDEYFPTPQPRGEEVVQVLSSGPDDPARVLHHLLFGAIWSARRSVCIATPYFVPDSVILLALQSAAYRRVRVRLLIPSRSNHRVVLWAGRSYYAELIASGVEIYEYDRGMLHSKVAIVDESWAMVGSANMDERSFRLNFEVTTIIYDEEAARELQFDFDQLLLASERITPDRQRDIRWSESLLLGAARLASPLL